MADVGEAHEKAQEVAGEAREKAQEAAGKAQDGLRQQLGQRSNQAGEQVSSTAQDLRSVGEELRKQGKETPAKLADRAAEQTEKVGGYLRDNDPDQMLHDIEDFGRQRPWAVLAGGMVLGIAAARFLKASSRTRYQERGTRTPTGAGLPQDGRRPPEIPRQRVEPVVGPATAAPAASPATPSSVPATPSAAP